MTPAITADLRARSRPSNPARNVFHVGSALTALACIEYLPSRGWLVACALAFAGAGWTMEITRRRSARINERLMRLFAPVAHPHEWHHVNSATWYATALVLLASVFPMRACALGVVALGFGDPAAALVGRRFGRTRLRAGRSLEGALAFVVAATLACIAMLSWFHGAPVGTTMAMAALAAAAGSVTEVFSTRVDDNFSIPVAVAAATWIATVAGLG